MSSESEICWKSRIVFVLAQKAFVMGYFCEGVEEARVFLACVHIARLVGVIFRGM